MGFKMWAVSAGQSSRNVGDINLNQERNLTTNAASLKASLTDREKYDLLLWVDQMKVKSVLVRIYFKRIFDQA